MGAIFIFAIVRGFSGFRFHLSGIAVKRAIRACYRTGPCFHVNRPTRQYSIRCLRFESTLIGAGFKGVYPFVWPSPSRLTLAKSYTRYRSSWSSALLSCVCTYDSQRFSIPKLNQILRLIFSQPCWGNEWCGFNVWASSWHACISKPSRTSHCQEPVLSRSLYWLDSSAFVSASIAGLVVIVMWSGFTIVLLPSSMFGGGYVGSKLFERFGGREIQASHYCPAGGDQGAYSVQGEYRLNWGGEHLNQVKLKLGK